MEEIEKELQVEIDEITNYASKKNYNLSMAAFSLLFANVHQLKTAFTTENMEIKYTLATMASISIILQLIVGILIILDHKIKIQTQVELQIVSKYNKLIHIFMFCIVVVNIVASGLGLA